jgi:hypothetical protein
MSSRRLRSLCADDLFQRAECAVSSGVKPLATSSPPAYINACPEGRYRSGQTGRTVNPLAYAFAGSNPALPTFFRRFDLDSGAITHRLLPFELCATLTLLRL